MSQHIVGIGRPDGNLSEKALVFIIQRNTDGISASMKLEGDATKLQLIIDNLNQFSFADNAKFNIAEP